jgi:6,7-dimethyl-8-ribityllumazine synthase
MRVSGGDISGTTVVWVPGSFELPIVAKRLAASGQCAPPIMDA